MSVPEHNDQERLARNFAELLQELRVAQNGVQLLFGFLLSLVFTDRYAHAGPFVHVTHVVTVLLAAGAVGMLIAPAAWHRLLFRKGRRETLIRYASRCAVIGLVLLAAAITGAVLLIGYVVFGGIIGGLIGGAIALYFALLWFVIPLWTKTFND